MFSIAATARWKLRLRLSSQERRDQREADREQHEDGLDTPQALSIRQLAFTVKVRTALGAPVALLRIARV